MSQEHSSAGSIINLISFDDEDNRNSIVGDFEARQTQTTTFSAECIDASGERLLPDIRRVLLTEIQYYREPFNIPSYERDDFFRDDGLPYSSADGSNTEHSATNNVAPPLPPRRYKSLNKSSLTEHLRNTGIDIDNSVTSESTLENTSTRSPSDPRLLNFDPFEGIDPFADEEEHFGHEELNNSMDHISRNSLEYDNTFNTSTTQQQQNENLEEQTLRRHERENTPTSYGNNLKTLSNQDILSLEGERDNIETTVTRKYEVVNRNSVTLPLRPPAKKISFRPASLNVTLEGEKKVVDDHYKKEIMFQSGLFQKVEERNEEAVAFCNFVAKLRKLYSSDDGINNNGFISAAKIRNKALFDISWNINIYFDPDPKTKQLFCKLSSKCSDVIHQFFNQFYNGNQSYELDLVAEQYTLRFVGFTSCITDDAPLSDFVIVQDCIKNGCDIQLALIRTNYMNVDFKRDRVDDEEECHGTYFNYYVETDTSSVAISEQGLSVLLDAYNNEAARLLQDVSQTHKVVYHPERLVQVVKAITKSLAQVELLCIQDGVNLLLELKRISQHSTLELYKNSREGRRDHNGYINPLHFDKGRFHKALQKLTMGVFSLIELYCSAFNTDFQIQNTKIPRDSNKPANVLERIDPRTINDNFCVRISSVHRIPPSWKSEYDEFEIVVALYYGGNMLCACKKTMNCRIAIGFFEQIRFYDLLEFDIPVRSIPRESKVTFTLMGLSSPKKGTDGRIVLGWVSCNAYDYQGLLLSGNKLFGFLSDVQFNPVATCATGYIQRPETVILKADFQLYHTDVLFPQPVLIIPGVISNNHSSSSTELEYVKKKMLRENPSLQTPQEKSIVWENRYALCNIPHALIHVLKSCPSWGSENVSEIHAIISIWEALPPVEAIEFLQADFPDKTVRETAVLWFSKISDDDLCEYLPELVQALKYEAYHNSALAQLFIKRSLMSSRVAHFLFWHLKYYTADLQFSQRFKIVLSGLLSAVGTRLRNELQAQDNVVALFSALALKVKMCKDSVRQVILRKELEILNHDHNTFPLRLPIEPSIKLSCFVPEKSTYFSSNAVPLKISLKNSDPRGKPVDIIYKIGDDLRKDLVTLLMFRVMNKLWLNEGLDLKMMLYKVLPTGPLKGLIEIVPNAATFREIHIQHGLTGSFKDDSLALWLQKYNSSEDQYKRAIENFTLSAAGYCVATYLLGIGDRHNDNIMLTHSGHLFHIDFSKFMGDVQKFGSISRDRVPFILTPDMAYVINNGHTPTENFQRFVEHCCVAFNIIRKKMKMFLNLLGLMIYSGISYLSEKEDLRYIRQNLQTHLTEDEATMYFTRLIENSLSSRSTQLNFFIHNIAQMKNPKEVALQSSKSSPLFSFSNTVHDEKTEGEIFSARIVDFQKRYVPEKYYVFVINILRSNTVGPKFIFRRYEDFQELHAKLCYLLDISSGIVLPELPPRVLIGRSQIREVARRRRIELDHYLFALSEIKDVWRSKIIYTFLHSNIKDNEEAWRFSEYVDFLEEYPKSRVGGKIKLSISYKNQALNILVMHAKNLIPNRIQGLTDPFVKSYVLPDPLKFYKRKTRVCRKTLNPTFNETLQYNVAWESLQKRVLQITLWDSNSLSENDFLGGINFYLSTMDMKIPLTGWFELTDVG